MVFFKLNNISGFLAFKEAQIFGNTGKVVVISKKQTLRLTILVDSTCVNIRAFTAIIRCGTNIFIAVLFQ
jgi:hypothetical protein